MKLTNAQKAALASYGRSGLAAVLTLVLAGNTNPKDLVWAAVAAVVPPILRALDPSDTAFGRGSK